MAAEATDSTLSTLAASVSAAATVTAALLFSENSSEGRLGETWAAGSRVALLLLLASALVCFALEAPVKQQKKRIN